MPGRFLDWTDPALIRRAQQGDAEAFGQLYQAYADRIYSYLAFRLAPREGGCQNPTEAEDLAAETFIRALNALDSFRWQGAPFGAWLFRIAHNVLVDYVRSQGRRETVPLEETIAVAGSTGRAAEDGLLTRACLQVATAQLTALQQQVIALRFAAGLSLAETARVMGKREGAVKDLQHKALAALRRRLARE